MTVLKVETEAVVVEAALGLAEVASVVVALTVLQVRPDSMHLHLASHCSCGPEKIITYHDCAIGTDMANIVSIVFFVF